MIGSLPKKLTVNGTEYDIRTDFRDCLTIFAAMSDPELSKQEKLMVMYQILYINYEDIPLSDMEEAIDQAIWFLDCGQQSKEDKAPVIAPLFDWEHDEQMIFAAVNHVAGKELRAEEYVHYWTFIAYFHEIGEGLFSTVIHIREKKRKGKLEKFEKEYYRNNKELIDLPRRYSKEEQDERNYINALLNGEL